MATTRDKVDTSTLLDKTDIDLLAKISQIQKDITSYFDMDLFIEHMRQIIDESKVFAFRSETAKKYIPSNKPVFILKIEESTLLTELGNIPDSDATESYKVDIVTRNIVEEIIKKMSRFISDCIKDEDKLNELFTELPDGMKEFLISNIYTIRVNIKANMIYVIYFI